MVGLTRGRPKGIVVGPALDGGVEELIGGPISISLCFGSWDIARVGPGWCWLMRDVGIWYGVHKISFNVNNVE